MPVQVIVNHALAARFANTAELLNQLAGKGAEHTQQMQGTAGSPAPGGAPPGIRSGELSGSIAADGPQVSMDGGHALFVEQGTRKMAARPSLLPGCLQTQDDVAALATAWLTGGAP